MRRVTLKFLQLLRYTAVCLSITRDRCSVASFTVQAAPRSPSKPGYNYRWEFSILDIYPTANLQNSTTTTLLEYLMSMASSNNHFFSSKSQARRAIRQGEIQVIKKDSVFDPYGLPIGLTTPSTPVSSGDRVHHVTRLPSNRCYPVDRTKHVYPPFTVLGFSPNRIAYQDDCIAVIDKPSGMTTIDSQSNDDLQSLLPFVLSPPQQTALSKQLALPRPVHRLDRGTCGLVLVAKTHESLRWLSRAFSDRQVNKVYAAVVFGRPRKGIGVIDHPMDGKKAQTDYKVVQSNDAFSLLELHPRTGRYHQIRRHLAYCLETPIVGDHKYDLVAGASSDVRKYRRSFRSQGLMLCCCGLDFEYNRVSASNMENRLKKDSNSIVLRTTDSFGNENIAVSIKLPHRMLNFFDRCSMSGSQEPSVQ